MGIFDKAKDIAENVGEKVKDGFEDVKDKVEEGVDKVRGHDDDEAPPAEPPA